jgi:hypothetical protein
LSGAAVENGNIIRQKCLHKKGLPASGRALEKHQPSMTFHKGFWHLVIRRKYLSKEFSRPGE